MIRITCSNQQDLLAGHIGEGCIVRELPCDFREMWNALESSDYLVLDENDDQGVAIGISLAIGLPVLIRTTNSLYGGLALEIHPDHWGMVVRNMFQCREEITSEVRNNGQGTEVKQAEDGAIAVVG